MKKKEAHMPRPGQTCRVNKPGDLWHGKQVAVTVVSNTGRAVCARWGSVSQALQSPQGSAARKSMARREYMPNELARVNLYAVLVGKSYVFMRDGHACDGIDVLVVDHAKHGYRVARCDDVAEWLFGKLLGAKEPKSWTAKANELF
jgi:hypothetical protein